jgi:Na+/proline symporter
LFGVIAINLKKVAPSAHTFAEIVNVRWGKTAHLTFLFFGFCANVIVTSMLLLGGAATVQALTVSND